MMPFVYVIALQDNEYIYSAFISPSGNGVKALVKIPPEIENHKNTMKLFVETFDSYLDAKQRRFQGYVLKVTTLIYL